MIRFIRVSFVFVQCLLNWLKQNIPEPYFRIGFYWKSSFLWKASFYGINQFCKTIILCTFKYNNNNNNNISFYPSLLCYCWLMLTLQIQWYYIIQQLLTEFLTWFYVLCQQAKSQIFKDPTFLFYVDNIRILVFTLHYESTNLIWLFW